MYSTSSSMYITVNVPPLPQFYSLSLHDALPISVLLLHEVQPPAASSDLGGAPQLPPHVHAGPELLALGPQHRDRKSTRLNSSHVEISYAVFCLKKKKHNNKNFIMYNCILRINTI